MNAASLMENFVEVGMKIDNLWSMYIVVHLGLFWFVLLIHRPMLSIERIMAWFAYTAFVFVNGNALLGSYRLLESLRIDLVTNFRTGFTGAQNTLELLTSATYADRINLIFLTHVGAAILVGLFLAFRNRILSWHDPRYLGAINPSLVD